METNKEYEFNLKYILSSLLRHWIVVLVATVLIGVGAFSYAKFFITPKYSSSVQLYVDNNSNYADYITSNEILVAQELVDMYIVILNTPDTLKAIKEDAGVDYSLSQISGMISAGSVNGTQIFAVQVTSPDPLVSAKIANSITNVLPERIKAVVGEKNCAIEIVQRPLIPSSPSSPNVSKYTLIGLIIGFALGCGLILTKELLNNAITDSSYPANTYNARTLAYIPNLSKGNNGKRKWLCLKKNKSTDSVIDDEEVLCENLNFGAVEAYKVLRTNIQNISDKENKYKVIGITSSNPKEGKSTMAINYSYILAQTGKKVVLVEGDMRKPVVAKRLALSSRLGLSDILIDKDTDAVQESGKLDNWKVISAGSLVNNPSELLNSRDMDLFIEKLRKEYDYVIVDLPPVNEVSDAMNVTRCLDGIICAVKQGETTKFNLEMAMQHMSYSKAEFMGFVITNTDIAARYGKKYYYYKGYRSYKEYREQE